MKRFVFILLSLCSAIGCRQSDTAPAKEWRRMIETRSTDARFTFNRWTDCTTQAEPSDSQRVVPTIECTAPKRATIACTHPIETREQAIALLVHGQDHCLDETLEAIQALDPANLAAAYLVRAGRRDDPLDLLRALDAADAALASDARSATALFNRALALELLGFRAAAIAAWNAAASGDSEWNQEARDRGAHLAAAPDPSDRWRAMREGLPAAIARRNRAQLAEIAAAFPSDAQLAFEETSLTDDPEGMRLFAEALAETGDSYARAILDAATRTPDRTALRRGQNALIAARRAERAPGTGDPMLHFRAAVSDLDAVRNPLALAARYSIAATLAQQAASSTKVLETVEPIRRAAADGHYARLLARTLMLEANALTYLSRYPDALHRYDEAIATAQRLGDATLLVAALTRKADTLAQIGSTEEAWRHVCRALPLLPRVAQTKARHVTLGIAATVASTLGHGEQALSAMDEAIGILGREIAIVPGDEVQGLRVNLAIALRKRAAIAIALGRGAAAAADLSEAERLAREEEKPEIRRQLEMRAAEVRGQALQSKDPHAAVAAFSEAIALITDANATDLALLHIQRAGAHRIAGDGVAAADDLHRAAGIIRKEEQTVLRERRRGEHEFLWRNYFARFQRVQQDAIRDLIRKGRMEEAFLVSEQTRGVEPLHLILDSAPVPAGFRPIATSADLARARQSLPPGVFIFQYTVLDERTYVWILSRDQFEILALRARAADVERWVRTIQDAVPDGNGESFDAAARAAYLELFEAPLARIAPAAGELPRLVIVPDGAMSGLPLAALESSPPRLRLVEQAILSVAGSTSLHLYARARDAEIANDAHPAVLLIGDPAVDPRLHETLGVGQLPYARAEARALHEHEYGSRSILLLGEEATVPALRRHMSEAAVLHFGGHAVANPRLPHLSSLLLAPSEDHSGQWTAEEILRDLPALDRTRLVVLGACSTAGGMPVGPLGLAPLVRPFVASGVPAVVGSLWDVGDATTQPLLVSFHRHYRHGDDVAVALRKAQLSMLRSKDTARNKPWAWAPFQVIGQARSPFGSRAANEETGDERISASHSLQRPDGLHPQ